MYYIFLTFLLIILCIIILIYPFKVTLYNEDNYLIIKISNILALRINLFVLLDNNHNDELKKQSKQVKLIKKIKFKQIDLRIQGLNFDYKINGAYFGLAYALLGYINKVCQYQHIDLNYNLNYLGDKSIEFRVIFRARVALVLSGFLAI